MNQDRRDDPSTYTLAIIGLIAIAALVTALVIAFIRFDNKFDAFERRLDKQEQVIQILQKIVLLNDRKGAK